MVKRERVHDGWWYPAEPGYSGETWAGWTEVALALDRGWDVQILERLLFPKGTRPAPLDTWQRRLLTIWSEAQHELVRRAVRSILLYTIGAFARAQREETRVLRRADTHLLPTDNGTIQRTATGDWTYRELVALPERERRYQHPEWAAEIWAKCRTRMLHYAQKRGRGEVVARWGALTLPREQILAFRTDALYLTHDPQWPDDGRPGSLRLKGAIRAPVRAPHTLAEINPLRDRAEDVLRGELAR
jgi:hypothetical protein